MSLSACNKQKQESEQGPVASVTVAGQPAEFTVTQGVKKIPDGFPLPVLPGAMHPSGIHNTHSALYKETYDAIEVSLSLEEMPTEKITLYEFPAEYKKVTQVQISWSVR